MEFLRRELRADDGHASFYASSSSSASPYPSDARFNRYDNAALGSSFHHNQVRQSSHHADSTYLGHSIGTAGTSLRDTLLVPSYREDRELEIRRCRLREIADRIELAHIRMLEEHDRRSLCIAERNPYARPIPFYPELPPNNIQVNHTAEAIPHSRYMQRVAPTFPEILDERCNVQRELSSTIRREEAMSSIGRSSLPELRDGARSHYLPVESSEVVHALGPARDICLDERLVHDPFLQNQFSRHNMMLPPRFVHEALPPLVVPVPVPITKKKVKSSTDTDKKRNEKYGHEVIEIEPKMQWSKWPCVRCSLNFDSKEVMDAHLQEQHQGGSGDCPSKSEEVENNRSTEGKAGLTVVSDGYQEELYEISGLHANKKCKLAVSPGKLKSNELHKGEVVASPEKNATVVSCSDKKIQPDLTQIPNEVVQTPENKESASSGINRKRKLDSPPMTLKQKHDKPIKEELMSLPKQKVKPATGTVEPGWISSDGGWFCSLCKINTLTKRDLDHHFQSNGHREKLNALLNKSKKSEPVNKIVAEKPGQGSQAVSLQKLEEPKEEISKSVHAPQSDELKEVAFGDKGNPSSSKRIVIMTGHKMAKQPPPIFSKYKNKNENNTPGNSSTKMVMVMQDGKWFCNLCEVKCLSEKNKEDHMKGKRHRQNLQAQAVARRLANKGNKQPKPAAKLHFCGICNISCTGKDALIEHFNGKKHRNLVMTNQTPAV